MCRTCLCFSLFLISRLTIVSTPTAGLRHAVQTEKQKRPTPKVEWHSCSKRNVDRPPQKKGKHIHTRTQKKKHVVKSVKCILPSTFLKRYVYGHIPNHRIHRTQLYLSNFNTNPPAPGTFPSLVNFSCLATYFRRPFPWISQVKINTHFTGWTGWWFQPSRKILVKLEIFPK